ncbi:MAG TPA: hypothetical protein VNS58_24530 [Puia sp.]|nr:hypothetical protein [Puia sp.]
MTLAELHNKLKELQISENTYYLHGIYGSSDDNDKMALTIRKGKIAVEYEVYFKEKGEKQSTKTFITEDGACQYIYRQLYSDVNK